MRGSRKGPEISPRKKPSGIPACSDYLLSGRWFVAWRSTPRACDEEKTGSIAVATAVGAHRRGCTLAATFRRSPFKEMNPVASDWLYACVGSASIVAISGLYRLTGLIRPAAITLPLYNFTRTSPLTCLCDSV